MCRPVEEEEEEIPPIISYKHPRGWWFEYKTFKTGWCGPFATFEEAEKNARMLNSPAHKTIRIIEMQLCEQRDVKLD